MLVNKYYFKDKHNYNCLNLKFKNNKVKYYYFNKRSVRSYYDDGIEEKYFIRTKGSEWHKLSVGEHKIEKLQIFISIIMNKKCFNCANCNIDYTTLKYLKNHPPKFLLT